MSGKDQKIPVHKASEPCIQNTDILAGDLRTLPVDRRLIFRDDLHVDAAHALLNIDEIIADADSVKKPLDLGAGKSGNEPKGRVVIAKILQRNRNIDAFASGINLLGAGPVNSACLKIIDLNYIIQCRTERNGIDQNSSSRLYDLFT